MKNLTLDGGQFSETQALPRQKLISGRSLTQNEYEKVKFVTL